MTTTLKIFYSFFGRTNSIKIYFYYLKELFENISYDLDYIKIDVIY